MGSGAEVSAQGAQGVQGSQSEQESKREVRKTTIFWWITGHAKNQFESSLRKKAARNKKDFIVGVDEGNGWFSSLEQMEQAAITCLTVSPLADEPLKGGAGRSQEEAAAQRCATPLAAMTARVGAAEGLRVRLSQQKGKYAAEVLQTGDEDHPRTFEKESLDQLVDALLAEYSPENGKPTPLLTIVGQEENRDLAKTELLVEGVSTDSQVYLDGRPLGVPGRPYAVPSGRTLIDVYTPGRQPYSTYVDLPKGERTTLQVPLQVSRYEEQVVHPLTLNPIHFRFALLVGWMQLSLGRLSDSHDSWLSGRPPSARTIAELSHDGRIPRELSHVGAGIGFDFTYHYKMLAITVASVSTFVSNVSEPVFVHRKGTDSTGVPFSPQAAVLTNYVDTRIAPVAVGMRFMLEPFFFGFEVGLNLHINFATVDILGEKASPSFMDTGISFHSDFTVNLLTKYPFYYSAGLRTEINLISPKQVAIIGYIGLGFAFSDFLGLQPKPPTQLEAL